MINPQDILDKSYKGLDIILHYYPQAKTCIGTKKPFKIRNEKTPSALIREYDNQWKVTDFGDDGQARSCFDICMMEENISFYQCLCLLAERYNISKQINPTVNKPTINQRTPTPEEIEQKFFIEYNDKWSEREMQFIGSKVTQQHLDTLKYKSVKWYSTTSKNKAGEMKTTIVESNDNYFIFAKINPTEKGEFIKIYQPLHHQKSYRFFSIGEKPKDYINGLHELKIAYQKLNEQNRTVWENNPINENKPYKETKIDIAIICSGERDAINCFSYGYQPLWLNSETATIKEDQYREIKKYTETLYNIPDIDSTGKKKGIELAYQYIDIRTVKLPEWLKSYKDIRGNPRKDLTDYLYLRRSYKDFKELIERANPYKFWEEKYEIKAYRENINTAYMLNLLSDIGFNKIKDDKTKKDTLIRISNNIVEEITAKEIREYLIQFVKEKTTSIETLNLVYNSNRTKTVTMEDLPTIELDFADNSRTTQLLYFKNTAVLISDQKIENIRYNQLDNYVWKHKIFDIQFQYTTPSFQITQIENEFNIDLLNTDSHYFRYIINSSRIHWRTELEKLSSGNRHFEEEYFEKHHFDIAGERLSEEEIEDQKQNLIAKIFAIGYLMHNYKEMSKAWAVWVMEDKISEDNESSGGSGKSFFFKIFENIKEMLRLGGRNKRLTEDKHIFENVTEYTDLILVDDADQYIDFDFFYDKITGDINVNEKHVKSKNINYEQSPKIAFTSNHTPRKTDSSTTRRLLYVVFSDWYHEKTEDNGYYQTRTINNDFGYDLHNANYTTEYWNQDISFLCDCLQFYLKIARQNIKIQPPMERVQERMNISTMGNQFKEWADIYFGVDSVNCDTLISRSDAFKDFENETGTRRWSTKQFTKALKAFCKSAKWIYELNPECLQNSQKRISRTINGKTIEMIYIRTYHPITTEPQEITDNPF